MDGRMDGSGFTFCGTGRIKDCSGDSLRIGGEEFDLCLDLRGAEFKNVRSETEVLRGGLNPEEYSEGLKLELSWDRFDLSATPLPATGKPN
jgi:hypothetical protein